MGGVAPPGGDGDCQRDDACGNAEPRCDSHEDDWKELEVSHVESKVKTAETYGNPDSCIQVRYQAWLGRPRPEEEPIVVQREVWK